MVVRLLSMGCMSISFLNNYTAMKSPKSNPEKTEIKIQRKPKGAEPENATSAKDAKKVPVKKK